MEWGKRVDGVSGLVKWCFGSAVPTISEQMREVISNIVTLASARGACVQSYCSGGIKPTVSSALNVDWQGAVLCCKDNFCWNSTLARCKSTQRRILFHYIQVSINCYVALIINILVCFEHYSNSFWSPAGEENERSWDTVVSNESSACVNMRNASNE
jgi:hypothetical protein